MISEVMSEVISEISPPSFRITGTQSSHHAHGACSGHLSVWEADQLAGTGFCAIKLPPVFWRVRMMQGLKTVFSPENVCFRVVSTSNMLELVVFKTIN